MIDTLLVSLSKSTLAQYQSSYVWWLKFCSTNNHNPFEVSGELVLLFFQYLLNNTNQRYGSFNTHRSALALVSKCNLAEDVLVKRFLRAVFKLRPSRAKYRHSWDPNIVLTYFSHVLDESVVFLTKKLAVLLLLASGQRLQTIAAIKRSNIRWEPNKVTIFIPHLLKTTSPRGYAPTIVLPKLGSNPNICVFSSLRKYVDLTCSSREEALFVSFKSPFKRVEVATITRWVREILAKAGIDLNSFSAYSTRHAAVSAAARKQVPLDVIFKAAGWTPGSSMFESVYNRPLNLQHQFASSVLS